MSLRQQIVALDVGRLTSSGLENALHGLMAQAPTHPEHGQLVEEQRRTWAQLERIKAKHETLGVHYQSRFQVYEQTSQQGEGVCSACNRRLVVNIFTGNVRLVDELESMRVEMEGLNAEYVQGQETLNAIRERILQAEAELSGLVREHQLQVQQVTAELERAKHTSGLRIKKARARAAH